MKSDIPRYPHVRVAKTPKDKLLVNISWGKVRTVTLVGNRITVINGGGKTNHYCLYLEDKEVGWWDTLETEMEMVN